MIFCLTCNIKCERSLILTILRAIKVINGLFILLQSVIGKLRSSPITHCVTFLSNMFILK